MKQTIFEKEMSVLTTNDGWIVSEWCCDPYKVKSELNFESDIQKLKFELGRWLNKCQL